MRTISFKLPDDLLVQLDTEAKARRVTKSWLVRESLKSALRKPSPGGVQPGVAGNAAGRHQDRRGAGSGANGIAAGARGRAGAAIFRDLQRDRGRARSASICDGRARACYGRKVKDTRNSAWLACVLISGE